MDCFGFYLCGDVKNLFRNVKNCDIEMYNAKGALH